MLNLRVLLLVGLVAHTLANRRESESASGTAEDGDQNDPNDDFPFPHVNSNLQDNLTPQIQSFANQVNSVASNCCPRVTLPSLLQRQVQSSAELFAVEVFADQIENWLDLCDKVSEETWDEATNLFDQNPSAGERGDNGPQGDEEGEEGEKGADGPKGKQGPTGPKGDQGEKGEEGVRIDGPKGDVGSKGDKGNKGMDQGPKGEEPKGEKGYKGDKGAVGPDGDQGEKGPDGEEGEEGEQGDSTCCLVGCLEGVPSFGKKVVVNYDNECSEDGECGEGSKADIGCKFDFWYLVCKDDKNEPVEGELSETGMPVCDGSNKWESPDEPECHSYGCANDCGDINSCTNSNWPFDGSAGSGIGSLETKFCNYWCQEFEEREPELFRSECDAGFLETTCKAQCKCDKFPDTFIPDKSGCMDDQINVCDDDYWEGIFNAINEGCDNAVGTTNNGVKPVVTYENDCLEAEECALGETANIACNIEIQELRCRLTATGDVEGKLSEPAVPVCNGADKWVLLAGDGVFMSGSGPSKCRHYECDYPDTCTDRNDCSVANWPFDGTVAGVDPLTGANCNHWCAEFEARDPALFNDKCEVGGDLETTCAAQCECAKIPSTFVYDTSDCEDVCEDDYWTAFFKAVAP